ncbi:Lac [Anthophora quadrimaculata]
MAYGLLYGMASRDIVLCFFLTVFLYSSFGQAMPKSEFQPEFLALLENHTVSQGRHVFFTCVVNHLQSYKVAWIKSDSKAILAIHTHMVAQNPRLSVTHNGHDTWKLHVTNVQPNDSGAYMCQINTDPMRSLTGHMKVLIPPDIMNSNDSADLLAVKENSDLQLRCVATGTPKPVVTWRREDRKNITLWTEHGVKRVESYEGEQLHLKAIKRQEMGSYLCIASNGVPPMVSKRYYVNVQCNFLSGAVKPLITVSDQLVAAPANSDVVLRCYVESWPKALNTWYRHGGIKLLSDQKYVLTEVPVNDYAYHLNLTIRRLNRNDFGNYTCSVENLLGKAEGTIRLQELHLTRTTSTPSRHNTEFIDKHGSKKQMDRKGKHYVFEWDGGSSVKNGGNTGHATSVLRRNSSNALTDVSVKKSKVSSYPAPAPAPAHFAPTQLNVQNSVTSLRQHSRLNCVELMFAFVAIVIGSF